MEALKITTAKPELFAATARFISNEETRYYLLGVYVHPVETGGIRMVATDGRRLFCAFDPDGTANRAAIIKPPKAKMPKAWFKAAFLAIEDGQFRLHQHDAEFAPSEIAIAEEIDGTFPDYERVIPAYEPSYSGFAYRPGSSTDGGSVFYNAAYLDDFRQISKALDCGDLFDVGIDGGNPAIVRLWGRDDCMGIIMPYRADTISLPQWLGTLKPRAEEDSSKEKEAA